MATRTTRNGGSSFETPDNGAPGLPEPTGGAQDNPEFEPPSGEGSMSAEAADAEVETFMAGVDGRILAAKKELEKLLASGSGESVGLQAQDVMEANIVGVGIGLGDATSASAGGAPGDPVLEVYTIERESHAETRARLASVVGTSAFGASDFPIRAVHTGIIDAQPHRMRLRPSPNGISCGHFKITAGTQGCLVRGNSAPRSSRLMILSNNHVLAAVNAGPIGAPILQPGPIDGGTNPADQVAILERFVPINFAAGASNVVDCATGWAWPDRVRVDMMYVSGGVVQYFRVGSTPVAATLGLQVGKTGRTTQLTHGGVTAVGATINVSYGGGKVGHFIGQIAVRTPGGLFSDGGDSGSLIWTWDARRAPVALLFAGGGGTTFANPIQRVLAALDVQLVV